MTQSRVRLACAVALLCVIGCALPSAANAAGIIVQREPGLSAHERAEIRADAGVTFKQSLPLPDAEVVDAGAGGTEAALAALKADPDVRLAVPDVRVHAAATLTDPRFPEQWALDSGSAPDINAPEAWQTASGQGAGVTVAVVDQLVDIDHPDLADSIDQRYRDHPEQYDFTQPDGCTLGPPTGIRDHGTHVAGTIAAQQDNGIGITGIAPYAKILPLRALDNCGGGDLSWIIKAFDAAGDAQIPIVNASLSTDPLMPADRKAAINSLLAQAIDGARDTLFVVAAGNEGNDNDVLPVYPCNTLLPDKAEPENLVCVGMTSRNDTPVCWGNVGPTSVDLFAPGLEILSTVRLSGSPGYGYLRLGGTSMAATMVSGAAALLKGEEGPLFSAIELHDRLLRGVDPYDGMLTTTVSGGRLNAERLVNDSRPLATKPGGFWTSCDRDHDTVLDSTDLCPDQPGAPETRGCPDSDGDGVVDVSDNCPAVANADQADGDGDGIGDACDLHPRGDDADGDGIPLMDDRCPAASGVAPDGCPVVTNPPNTTDPTPTATPTATPSGAPDPVIVSLEAKISKCPKGKKCKKTAKVTVKLSRQGKVALKVERQERKKGRLVWKRIKSQSLTANARGKSLTVRGKSAKTTSKYRVTATLAGKVKAVSFKV